MTADCKHEFVYDELHGQAVCVKCGYVVTKEDKRAALDHSMRLLFSDIDTIIDQDGGDGDG